MADKFCKLEWQCNCKRIKVCRGNYSCSKEWRELTITETNIIVNSPAINWQDGSLQVKENKNITGDPTYWRSSAQCIYRKNDCNNGSSQRMGPDGKTVYYIATDATPKMPADMVGVPYVQSDEKLIGMPVVVDLFQFTNGIKVPDF